VPFVERTDGSGWLPLKEAVYRDIEEARVKAAEETESNPE
jgi:hypothetical protein